MLFSKVVLCRGVKTRVCMWDIEHFIKDMRNLTCGNVKFETTQTECCLCEALESHKV